MKRPTRVTIGPFVYRILWPEHVLDVDRYGDEDDTLETLSARCDHFTLTIHVSSRMAPVVQRKSLLHEIIHACNWITGHDDATTEEQFVRSLAFPLLEVMRRNPGLVAWLME